MGALSLVDSSGWIEYIRDGPKADAFGQYLIPTRSLLMPSIVVYEIHKLLLTNNADALDPFDYHASRAKQVLLDSSLAAAAAKTSAEHRLGVADAIVYATAQSYSAQLVTLNRDFNGLPGVIIL